MDDVKFLFVTIATVMGGLFFGGLTLTALALIWRVLGLHS